MSTIWRETALNQHQCTDDHSVPHGVGGVTAGQKGRYSVRHFLVCGHVPQAVCTHDQDVVWAVVILRQVVHLHLETQPDEQRCHRYC